MYKALLVLIAACTMLLIFGCSESPNITNPDDGASITLVQRPEFVDTRPQTVIASHVIMSNYAAEKKPPPPPPDPGGDDPNPNPAHKYAYIVGISDYEGTANDLQYCDDDAQGMKAYYQSQGFTIRMDTDRNATAANIQAGLEWLVANASPGDEIAFAYSGHGVNYPGYGSCIISTDLYYITHGFVMQIVNSAACSKNLVTLDACEAGSFLSDCITGEIIATASTNGYSYDAPDLQHGAWTYYFLYAAENLNYPFAEDVISYAESGMKAWARTYHLRVSPSHTDNYAGMFDM